MDLDVTQDQLNRFDQPAHLRETIQDIFPNLSPDEREFIKTGITSEEWDNLF